MYAGFWWSGYQPGCAVGAVGAVVLLVMPQTMSPQRINVGIATSSQKPAPAPSMSRPKPNSASSMRMSSARGIAHLALLGLVFMP